MRRKLGLLVAACALLAATQPTAAYADPPRASNGNRCTIVGTPGADRLVGTTSRDVICGRGGTDRIVGGRGYDVLDGGPGNDTILGDRGADLLYGGDGNDRLYGGTERDRLLGGKGDDLLMGDRGDDLLEGGLGADRCPYEPSDFSRISCVFDHEWVQMESLTVSQPVVDATHGDHVVTVRVHLTDDTRIDTAIGPSLSLRGYDVLHSNGLDRPYDVSLGVHELRLVSGSLSDGIWQARVTVPRGFPAAKLKARVMVRDLSHRDVTRERTRAIEVVNEIPDGEFPRVDLLAPASGTRYDATKASAAVKVRARITDADTGVAGRVQVCVTQWDGPGSPTRILCAPATRVSGNSADGVWAGAVTVPKGVIGPNTCVAVVATDRARKYDDGAMSVCDAAWSDHGPYIFEKFVNGGGEILLED